MANFRSIFLAFFGQDPRPRPNFFPGNNIGFFSVLTYLRRARFRKENRIFFSTLTVLAENLPKIDRIFFSNFKVFKAKMIGFFFFSEKNP